MKNPMATRKKIIYIQGKALGILGLQQYSTTGWDCNNFLQNNFLTLNPNAWKDICIRKNNS